ncbi:MAG: hypothetical protein P8184_17980 [Calditrichia bacterium]
MKETKEISISLSPNLYEKMANYARQHEIPLEKVIQMALIEFFEVGPLLEGDRKRKQIWDIIDVPEDDY